MKTADILLFYLIMIQFCSFKNTLEVTEANAIESQNLNK